RGVGLADDPAGGAAGMIWLAGLAALTAGAPENVGSIDPKTWNPGDLVFVCQKSEEGRHYRTFILHYAPDGREVAFNHQGPDDAFSDGYLLDPVKTVNFRETADGATVQVEGSGVFEARQYSFNLTLALSESAPMTGSFEILAGGKSMSGKDCMRIPPRPIFKSRGDAK
ncbi:MAG: hypothetical protein ACK4GG_07865, partial [Sphingomonas sp.]